MVTEKSEGLAEKLTKKIPLIKNWSPLSRTVFITIIFILILLGIVLISAPDFN